MPPDWPQLLLACIADDAAGAKTLDAFRDRAYRRTELAKVVGMYAKAKAWRRVRLDCGAVIGPGEAKWTDFVFAAASAEVLGDALLSLDCA